MFAHYWYCTFEKMVHFQNSALYCKECSEHCNVVIAKLVWTGMMTLFYKTTA